jgi:hypothetical protein
MDLYIRIYLDLHMLYIILIRELSDPRTVPQDGGIFSGSITAPVHSPRYGYIYIYIYVWLYIHIYIYTHLRFIY